MTIQRGSGVYTKYQLIAGTADSQYSYCRVYYADPKTGKCIEGIAKVDDYNNDAKIFWEKIFEQDQHTMDYIIKWLRENPNIKEIYISHPENKVCFLDDKESMFDVDKCVTNFIKKNDISLCGK